MQAKSPSSRQRLQCLIESTASISFKTLEEAFGESSLGILIVSGLPAKYKELRHKLLSYASYLAELPPEILGKTYHCSLKVIDASLPVSSYGPNYGLTLRLKILSLFPRPNFSPAGVTAKKLSNTAHTTR